MWLTHDAANLDTQTGGLDVYDVEAPISWGFEKIHNKDGRAIRDFLRRAPRRGPPRSRTAPTGP